MQTQHFVWCIRYYPYYHGKRNTRYSYNSWFITPSTDFSSLGRSNSTFVGLCDASVPLGWVQGVRGAGAARTWQAVTRLPGYTPPPMRCRKCGMGSVPVPGHASATWRHCQCGGIATA